MRRAFLLSLLALALASQVEAQTEWTYRGRATAEMTATDPNDGAPLGRAAAAAWQYQYRLVASTNGTWSSGDRFRAGAALAALATNGSARLRVREMYVRAAAASWLELEAGKRILRWGVGYGFAPAGTREVEDVKTTAESCLSPMSLIL